MVFKPGPSTAVLLNEALGLNTTDATVVPTCLHLADIESALLQLLVDSEAAH